MKPDHHPQAPSAWHTDGITDFPLHALHCMLGTLHLRLAPPSPDYVFHIARLSYL